MVSPADPRRRKGAPRSTPSSSSGHDTPRRPRGSGAGGQFADRVFSEPEIVLGSDDVGELDGSKGQEEMARRRDEALKIREQEEEQKRLASEQTVLADLEKSFSSGSDALEGPKIGSTVNDIPSPIQLGGNVKFDEGTIEFPFLSNDLRAMANFFAHVEIPDHHLRNIENADCWGRDVERYQAEFDEWWRTMPTVSRRWLKKNGQAAYEAMLAERDARRAYVDQIRFGEGLVPRHELRDVARMSGFWVQARKLDETSRSRAAQMEFVTSDGRVLNGFSTYMHYRMFEIEDALFGQRKYPRLR